MGTPALHFQFLPFFNFIFFQMSPSPGAGVSSSKRNLFAWECGDSRKFSLSSGSSAGAPHLVPQLLSRMERGAGLRQSCCCHSQGWLMHSAALGRSLWSRHSAEPSNIWDYWVKNGNLAIIKTVNQLKDNRPVTSSSVLTLHFDFIHNKSLVFPALALLTLALWPADCGWSPQPAQTPWRRPPCCSPRWPGTRSGTFPVCRPRQTETRLSPACRL